MASVKRKLELKFSEIVKLLIKVYPLGNFSINEGVRYKKHIMFGCLTFKQLWEFSFKKLVGGFFRIIGIDFISKIVYKYLFGLKLTKNSLWQKKLALERGQLAYVERSDYFVVFIMRPKSESENSCLNVQTSKNNTMSD